MTRSSGLIASRPMVSPARGPEDLFQVPVGPDLIDRSIGDPAVSSDPFRPGIVARTCDRLATLPAVARLSLRIELARRREAWLLARLGEAVWRCGSSSTAYPDVQETLDQAARLGTQLETLNGGLAASLRQDRSDYPSASSCVKPAVILRGLLARLVLRDQARQVRGLLRPLHRLLGAAWLDGRLRAQDGSPRPEAEALALGIAEQRRDVAAAEAERTRLVEPFGGKAVPGWAEVALKECRTVVLAFGKEARGAVFPRLPGLAGMAAGWWIAHAYTASRWDHLLDRFGLRHGGPKVVSAETYDRLHFWVPLVAAALCAYLCTRLSAALRKRYAPEPTVEAVPARRIS